MLGRAFKEEADALASELRAELGLQPQQRLDPFVVAAHLGVPTISLRELQNKWAADPASVELFLSSASGHFSAATVTDGSFRLIIYNESHSGGRRANSLTHELAHIVLGHEPTPISDLTGLRLWNREVEDQADWLAAALLVPRAGALALTIEGYSVTQGATHYGVSTELYQWRVNQTGVRAEAEQHRTARAMAAGDPGR
jgi:hypothetical protein